jgi:hypothetical protein
MLTSKSTPEAIRKIVGSSFSYDTVEVDPSVTFLLDPEFRIVYCNLAWNRFALENGAPELVREKAIGVSILDVCADPLNGFYQHVYTRTQKARDPWEHDYECSSAGQYRHMRMRVLPLPHSFLLVENSVRIQRPHTDVAVDASRSAYTDPRGMIVMCAHCRRTRHPAIARWDWIPAFVANLPENASHGLCKNCRAFYFGV